MSAYEPKHLRQDDSLEARVREAGRRMLHGTLSVILAMSLVPAVPVSAYADDSEAQQQAEQQGQDEKQQQGQGQQSDDSGQGQSERLEQQDGQNEQQPEQQQDKQKQDEQGDQNQQGGGQQSKEPKNVESSDEGTKSSDMVSNSTASGTAKNSGQQTQGNSDDSKDNAGKDGATDTQPANDSALKSPGEGETEPAYDNEAPTLTSFKIYKEGGAQPEHTYGFTDNRIDLSGLQPQEKADASRLVITVSDDALDLAASYVEAYDESGESILQSRVQFYQVAGSEETPHAYEASVEGVTGRITLYVEAKSKGVDAPTTTIVGGSKDDEDGKIKADSSLVIDGSTPQVASVKVSAGGTEKEISVDSEASAPVYVNNAKTGAVIVAVRDESLDTTNVSNARLVKVGDLGLESEITGLSNAVFSGEQAALTGLYTATLDITTLDSGSYKVKVQAQDTFHGKGDAAAKNRHQKLDATYGTLVVDKAAPVVASAVVVAANSESTELALESNKKYAGNKLQVTLTESNLDTENSTVTLKKTGSEGDGTSYTWANYNDEQDPNKFVLSDIEEGQYEITIHAVDLAGNVADDTTYAAVVLDTLAPRVDSFTYVEAKTYTKTNTQAESDASIKVVRLKEEGQGSATAVVTIPITDFSLNKDDIESSEDDKMGGVAVTVKKDDAAYEGALLTWGDTSVENKTEGYLQFSEAGTYKVSVVATDTLGNKAKSHVEEFVVSDQPTVEVTQTSGTTIAQDTEEPKYVNTPAVFEATIKGTYIDESSTYIAGQSIRSIKEGLVGKNSTYTPEGKKFTFSLQTATGTSPKLTEYVVTITYSEGAFAGDDLPVVKAKDWYLAAPEAGDYVTSANYQPFTVDLTAPSVGYSMNTDKYFNYYSPDESAKKDKILFFRKGQLRYTITDGLSGIASAVIKDSHGYDRALNLDDAGNDAVNLLEDHEFTQDAKLIVTDNAGNESIWTLKQTEEYAFNAETGEFGIVNATPTILWKTKENEVQSPYEVQSPIKLVEDIKKPFLEFVDVDSLGEYNNENVSIPLSITEQNFSYLCTYAKDVCPVVITRTKVGGKPTKLDDNEFKFLIGSAQEENAEEFKWKLPVLIQAKEDHSNDGDYLVEAQLTDMAGNESNTVQASFTIDTTAPEFTVTYDNNDKKQTANDKDYYDKARTATIIVNEHNFDSSLFDIELSFDNYKSGAAKPSYVWDNSESDEHTCKVTFPSDGEYTLKVSGKDRAGNAALLKVGETLTTKTVYETDRPFVIDRENPIISDVELPTPTGTYAGKNYYSHGINVDARVKDRNFDPANSTVLRYHNGTETEQDVSWTLEQSRDQAGDGYEVYRSTVTYAEDGDYKSPHVKVAQDFAGRTSENAPVDFVVDLEAPTISVQVDREPTSTGAGNEQNDPIQFFNLATRMTFTMTDPHLLRSYKLDDPEGEYVVSTTTQNVEGKESATLVVALKDGASARNDTEYERNITLTAQDLAGNRRIWTIDRTGRVVKDEVESSSSNTPINNEDVFPVALIQDTTAPVVTLTGVTAGTYYNTTQTVRAVVNEFNYDYLKRFDPARVVLYVTKREGNAGRAQSTWTVPASSFNGSRPEFTFDQPFDTDGHYELYAEFSDYANNRSNRASIGEFTIDKTAPVISVTWNSPAGNAPYYRETRVATITVTEHNFDGSLFTVDTTGSKSGWTSSGDTHTMTVTFDADGAYTMNITGRDQAGNEASAYTEPTFYIDKTAPTVTIAGTVQRYGLDRGETDESKRENYYNGDISNDGEMPDAQNPEETLQDHHAYNGSVAPVIQFRDQSGTGYNFYTGGTASYTLTGGKHGDLTTSGTFSPEIVAVNDGAGTGENYQFSDFGLLVANDGGSHNVYDPEADDVYTLAAQFSDAAGNEAKASVVFSVNRYGSNYVVSVLDLNGKEVNPKSESEVSGLDYDLLPDAPTIEVKEINVSGSESNADHDVLKEYANKVTSIDAVAENDNRKDGFELVELAEAETETKYGWSEYRYTIRPGNFGENSPSDSGDGGQGLYRVNVTSVDRASNDSTTADYLNTGEYEKKVNESGASASVGEIAGAMKNATATFTLDQIGPAIDELGVPGFIHVGTTYAARVHVTDAITRGDEVQIRVDGVKIEPNMADVAPDGTGTYEFEVATNYIPFAMHDVEVVVSDGLHENAVASSQKFMVTILVPEILSIAAVAGIVVGGVLFYRRRKATAEPDMPGTYE